MIDERGSARTPIHFGAGDMGGKMTVFVSIVGLAPSPIVSSSPIFRAFGRKDASAFGDLGSRSMASTRQPMSVNAIQPREKSERDKIFTLTSVVVRRSGEPLRMPIRSFKIDHRQRVESTTKESMR